MPAPSPVEVVQSIYAAFARGDGAAVLAAVSEDVECLYPQPKAIPWGGVWRGRNDFARFLGLIAEHVQVLEFVPERYIAQGDTVVAIGRERLRATRTGREYAPRWSHLWTVRDGRAARFEAFTDTAAATSALR